MRRRPWCCSPTAETASLRRRNVRPRAWSAAPSNEAAARAAELGVQVHTVLAGPATETDPASIAFGATAETTGGSAYTADTASGLIDVYQMLESEISTELEISDFGALFIVAAAALAIAATIAILIAIRSDY